MRRFCVVFLAWFGSVAGAVQPVCVNPADVTEALSCLPGTRVTEVLPKDDPKMPEGYRRFEVQFDQPVDHFNPAAGTFRQRLVILHKHVDEPLILQTSGYAIFSVALTQLAKSFGANQIQVEHRFFDQSTPAVMDWRKLDVLQSAMDFHRISVEFKKVYPKPWVNTGASKGGMTSVFHRRYFPQDTAGTVADVAPLSFSTEDQRYIQFVDEVGGETWRKCREDFQTLQLAMLRRRHEVMPLIKGSFIYLGGKSVAYEHAVIELPFAFWQYLSPTDPKAGCDKMPAPDAPAEDLAAYLTVVNNPDSYSDSSVFSFMPYYFQAATQLGSPAAELNRLAPYRLHPYHMGQYTPRGWKTYYSNRLMREMEHWTRTQADHILFVYGEFDPWTAGAYPRRKLGSDFHWFQVPGGNHSSKFFKLPKAERDQALAIVGKWLGKKGSYEEPPPSWGAPQVEYLEDLEFRQRRPTRLP